MNNAAGNLKLQVEILCDSVFESYVWLENGAFTKEMVFREYLEEMIFPNEIL